MSDKKRLEENKEVTQNTNQAQQNYVDEQTDKISQEAVEAINLVVEVLDHLQKKDKEEALQAIEKALGKLEILISKDPELAAVPIDVQEQVIDFPGTVEDVIIARDLAKALLDEGEVQKARQLLQPLASELAIYITELPIAVYPEALKAIIPLIEQEKFEEAILLVQEVLKLLVVEKITIPLPILRAEYTIKLAAELANNDGADREQLKALLAYAKEQLLLAQVLGYGRVNEDYKDLLDEIQKIEKILEDEKQETKGIFDALLEKLSALMKRFNTPEAPANTDKK